MLVPVDDDPAVVCSAVGRTMNIVNSCREPAPAGEERLPIGKDGRVGPRCHPAIEIIVRDYLDQSYIAGRCSDTQRQNLVIAMRAATLGTRCADSHAADHHVIHRAGRRGGEEFGQLLIYLSAALGGNRDVAGRARKRDSQHDKRSRQQETVELSFHFHSLLSPWCGMSMRCYQLRCEPARQRATGAISIRSYAAERNEDGNIWRARLLHSGKIFVPESVAYMPAEVSLAEIKRARDRIHGFIYCSPCAHTEEISQLTGQQVYLKLDNLQRTGAFKERGALNRILTLSDVERSRGLIAASAGNHAQAVAYHASQRGIRSVIVMPMMTPLVKVSATRGFGAEVVLFGANYEEACAKAMEICREDGLTFLHPFDDPAVINGQGTLGLELLDQVPGLEAVVVPIGGGGLISGVACAIKESNPRIRVVGVQTERLPSMLRAIEGGAPVTLPPEATIADGIAVRRAGDLTFPLVKKYVDEIVTVDEEEIAKAILVLLEREKLLAEGAGAAALAALLQKKTSLKGERTAVLICGGNIDVSLLAKIIERGLVKDGRRMRLRIHLSDRPGALHLLTRILMDQRANIVQTQHDRAYYGVNLGDTVIDMTLETRGTAHIAEILAALTHDGYRHQRIE